MRSRSGVLIRYFHCCFTDKSDILIAYQQLCFSKTNSSQENQSYLWKDDNYIITIIVMQKPLASVGWLEFFIFIFIFLLPRKEWVSKGHFFNSLIHSKQPGRIHYMHSVIKVTRTWQIADESLLTHVASILGATHSDTSRLSPLGSEGSPRTQECWRGVPEFPPRPPRSPDATDDEADSRGRRRGRGCSVTWQEKWMTTKRLGDQKTHTHTDTHRRARTSQNRPHFSCYSASRLSPGLCPACRACIQACVRAHLSVKRINSLTDARLLPSGRVFRLECYTRLPLLYISQSSLRARQWPCYGCKELCADQFSLFQVRVSKPP